MTAAGTPSTARPMDGPLLSRLYQMGIVKRDGEINVENMRLFTRIYAAQFYYRLWISGSSRHCAPIRTIKSIPLSFIQLSFYGHPRFPVSSGGSNGLVCSHCSFVNSYPFMLVASHSLVSCSILIFGRTKDMVWKLIFSEYILGLPTDRIDCVNGVTLRGFPVSRGREEWE